MLQAIIKAAFAAIMRTAVYEYIIFSPRLKQIL